MTLWRDLGPYESSDSDPSDDDVGDDVTRAFHLDWDAWYDRLCADSERLPDLAGWGNPTPPPAPPQSAPRGLPYTALDAAEAMERAGVLTSEAMRAIGWFGAHGAVSAVTWYPTSRHGYVTYCGRVYPVARFNALFAHTGYQEPDTASLDEPLEEPEEWRDLTMGLAALPSEPLPPLAAAAVVSDTQGQASEPARKHRHGRHPRLAGCAGLVGLGVGTLLAGWLIGMLLGALVVGLGAGWQWLIGLLATPR